MTMWPWGIVLMCWLTTETQDEQEGAARPASRVAKVGSGAGALTWRRATWEGTLPSR